MRGRENKLRYQREGIVLGVIVILFLVLAVFIFSYNTIVRRQNIEAHHELISETASILAIRGVQLFAEVINSSINTIIQSVAPLLLSSVPTTSTINVGSSHSVCCQLRDDYNTLLQQVDYLYDRSVIPNKPARCVEMDISFENISQISPDTDASQFEAGRDPVEKVGEIVISCTVEYKGLKRTAKMKRQFKVVSMVAGPFCRFTYFVPYTPWTYSYNSLGVAYSGAIDTTYTHPFPSAKSYTFPLKLYNGTDTSSYLSPDDKADLKNRGWIFIGPSLDFSTSPPSTYPVVLKIPSGYNYSTGGHFMLCLPPNVSAGKEVVRPERIDDSTNFNIPSPSDPNSFIIGGLFQGYFTYDPGLGVNAERGAAGYNLWPNLLQNPSTGWTTSDRWLCASTWLYPFGDRNEPTRTLIVGPVLAAFLKLYFMKATDESWKTILRGYTFADYDPEAIIPIDNYISTPPTLKYKDIFLQPNFTDPSNKQGFTSYQRVMPLNSDVNPTSYPPAYGYALNVFFDFMKYPSVGSPYPDIGEGSQLLQNMSQKFYVPNAESMKNPPSGIKGLHAYENFRILFTETGSEEPTVDPNNCYFFGNLLNYRISDKNLLRRVTHYLDMTDALNLAEENDRFKDFLFRPANSLDSPPTSSGWYVPKKAGIFFIRRRSSVPSSLDYTDYLSLPGKIWLTKPLIVIIEKGNILIPETVQAKITNGCPQTLFTIVSLDGNIILGTKDEIHAYLVALKPNTGSAGSGGKLLALNSSIKRMNIFGGLAVWEVGLYRNDNVRTTMGDFTDGGVIRYNPRFNPSSELYPASRIFVMEERASQIEVTGAN